MLTEKRRQKAFRLGIVGERLATFWLACKGYRILESRYRSPVGEIDLIARKGKIVAFTEVKARLEVDVALESVTVRQRQRIVRAAGYWQSRYGCKDDIYRFDVIAIGRLQMPRHIKNAWDASI